MVNKNIIQFSLVGFTIKSPLLWPDLNRLIGNNLLLQKKVLKIGFFIAEVVPCLLCLDGCIIVFVQSEEKGHQQDKGPFGAKIKIMWEEQLVDPPIDYKTSVNVP